MSILYTNAILSVRSGRILTMDRIRRMIAAPDSAQAAKILFECGYDELLITEKPDREDLIINAEMKKTVESLRELCPSPLLLNILQARFDYHNAAAIYNFVLANVADGLVKIPADSLYPFGNVGLDKLKDAIVKKDYSVCPEPMREALLRLGSDSPFASLVDLELTKAMYADIMPKVKTLGNRGVINFFKTEIDFANMHSYAKARFHGKVGNIFIEGGFATEDQLGSILSKDPHAAKSAFASLPYMRVVYRLVASLDSLDLSVFEYESKKYLAELGRQGEEDSFALNPLLGWWVTKWEEMRIVKTILVGKKLGMTREDLYKQLGI